MSEPIYPETIELSGGNFKMFSPAKVNLGLRILGKRDDGYHEIETLFQEMDWCDEIEFAPSSDFEFHVEGDAPSGEENLVVKAARLLSKTAGVACLGRITLRKSIPSGGGLGGGSSNAAIALLGLSRLWDLNCPIEQIHNLAAELGSDCPFFLRGGLALGKGRGELLDWLPGRLEGSYLVAVPSFGIKSAWAYSEFISALTEVEKNVIFSSIQGIPQEICGLPCFALNHLENVVLRRYSLLADIKQHLIKDGAFLSLLSGSGSSVFGIFSEHSQAEHAAQRLESLRVSVRICQSVARRALR